LTQNLPRAKKRYRGIARTQVPAIFSNKQVLSVKQAFVRPINVKYTEARMERKSKPGSKAFHALSQLHRWSVPAWVFRL
jgi:hypothetical protein